MDQIEVYKMLKVLHRETNQQQFESMLVGFSEYLATEEKYADFSKYFREQYLKNKMSWAACYRIGSGITTNNYVEAFHSVFKTHYLFGKKNNRVDKCLHTLLKYSRDLGFKRTRKLAKILADSAV